MGLLEFAAVAAMCAPNVHLTTLEAIVTHESRANVYAIGVNSKDYRLPKQPESLEEAVSTANLLISKGYDFDSGLGQINVRNLEWLGITIEEVFDPCVNLQAAEKVLTTCYARAAKEFEEGQPALQAALSCYNTGNFTKGFENGYVKKVASHVGTTVPALKVISSDSSKLAPVMLSANDEYKEEYYPENHKKNNQKTLNNSPQKKEGIDDAFGVAFNDAFSE